MCPMCGKLTCGGDGGRGGRRARPAWLRRCFAWATAASDAANNRLLGERKRALFAGLAGDVLEIGPGTGANLPYLPAGVRWTGVEPNEYMHCYLRKAAQAHGLVVDLRSGVAERLPAPDASVDAVVGTLVLCSVDDVAATLAEVKRVLKPGGRFVFVEHVAAPAGTWRRRIQRVIRPLWQIVADGCHPDRETWGALERAGFAALDYERFTMDVPLKFLSPGIAGTATTAA